MAKKDDDKAKRARGAQVNKLQKTYEELFQQATRLTAPHTMVKAFEWIGKEAAKLADGHFNGAELSAQALAKAQRIRSTVVQLVHDLNSGKFREQHGQNDETGGAA